MNLAIIDWVVLLGTLLLIVGYGTWKTRKSKDLEGYLKGGNDIGWATIGLSIMATQASAITFLSTPGLAFESGMKFIQMYIGLPIAMILISAFALPIYHRLKVYTAYEYLENRFDLKTRLLGAFLFLVQRGLAAGITIYAPAIILTTVLGWNLNLTIIIVGTLVVVYTMSGGTRAVSITQKWQMAVIMGGMFLAFMILLNLLPEGISFGKALDLAGATGRMTIIDTEFNPSERYNIWAGLTGGTFLALSYFGTDQSQVQRYISGRSLTESRLGLLFNGLMKIPMQFFILLIGVFLYVFYLFQPSPLWFNQVDSQRMLDSEYKQEWVQLDQEHQQLFTVKQATAFSASNGDQDALLQLNVISNQEKDIKKRAKTLLEKESETAKDSDYVFITFVVNFLPKGVVGLLLAVIFSAAMSSTAGELNALASTTTIDFYKRIVKPDASSEHYVSASKLFTLLWGLIAILFALFAHFAENLIEAVNILGSIFYGTILGIFVVAFFLKWIKSKAVFYAAVIGQLIVIVSFMSTDIGYLFFNVIGCALVVILSILFQQLLSKSNK